MGFAIVFGNEDTANWIKFWKFIKSIHPIVNQPTKTFITDQDKGSLSSIRQSNHMVAIVKQGAVPNLMRVELMPF